MTLKTLLLVSTLTLAQSLMAQQIFRTTDEHGNVIFTDKPPASSTTTESVELPPTNTTPATPIPQRTEPEPEPEEPESAGFKVAITVPTNETTIPMGPGNFSVTVKVEPALGQGASLQLYMDGIPWGDPQRNKSWALTNVFRGGHDITVAVVDEEGQHLASSEPVRVYVLRPSINSPARRAGN
jgi:hypothetical protein